MLNNVRVLDLSRVLAGPLCAMTLGDLGADVLKVERPGAGDETRGWGPPFSDNGESAYYLAINRNKLSLALDLDDPTDLERLMDLIQGSDVVVDNFRRGTLERRGLSPEDYLERRPSLIWCTITGFGADSPRPGYDFVVQAESGWMAITGTPEGEPMKVGIALADVVAGKDAAIAILGVLAARTGPNGPLPAAQRRIFVSLAHSATAALVNVAQNVLVSGGDAARWGNAHPNLVPYQLFPASDRYLVIAVGSDAQWLACCAALELDDLAANPALQTNAGRLRHRATVIERLTARVSKRTAGEWRGRLQAAGVPCGLVRSVRDALDDVPASRLTGVGPATGGTVRLPPPGLDEHGPLVRARGWDAFRHVGRPG
jgi:glutaryl-CoA transferase